MRPGKLVEDLGTLSLVEQTIQYRSSFYPPWSLAVPQLRLIGEYTNEDGPHVSDHFVIFFASNERVYEAPDGAEGVSPVLRSLEEILGDTLAVELTLTTTFASRVMWPRQLEGQPIFNFHQKADSFTDKLRNFLGFGRVEQWLRPEIRLHAEGRRD